MKAVRNTERQRERNRGKQGEKQRETLIDIDGRDRHTHTDRERKKAIERKFEKVKRINMEMAFGDCEENGILKVYNRCFQ